MVIIDSSVVLKVAESRVDGLVEVVEVLPDLLLGGLRQLELHAGQFGDDVTEGLLDVAHRNLLIGLGAVKDEADAILIELDDSFHHAHGFVHRAVVVVLGEGVLLQELVLDNLGGLSQLNERNYLP